MEIIRIMKKESINPKKNSNIKSKRE